MLHFIVIFSFVKMILFEILIMWRTYSKLFNKMKLGKILISLLRRRFSFAHRLRCRGGTYLTKKSSIQSNLIFSQRKESISSSSETPYSSVRAWTHMIFPPDVWRIEITLSFLFALHWWSKKRFFFRFLVVNEHFLHRKWLKTCFSCLEHCIYSTVFFCLFSPPVSRIELIFFH